MVGRGAWARPKTFDETTAQRALEAEGAAAVLAFLLEHTGEAGDLVIVQAAAYMNVDQRDKV